ncbi:MAG TPA: hypothetical protein PK788_07660 [Gemmatimonadaceae bacterium]|nr:hypothetical protein [Gemmatimonadaceae bacterium]
MSFSVSWELVGGPRDGDHVMAAVPEFRIPKPPGPISMLDAGKPPTDTKPLPYGIYKASAYKDVRDRIMRWQGWQ